MKRIIRGWMLAALALVLGGCAVNLHPQGSCPTPGVSPFASNCPSPEDLKGK